MAKAMPMMLLRTGTAHTPPLFRLTQFSGPICQRCQYRLLHQATHHRHPIKPLNLFRLHTRFASTAPSYSKSLLVRLKNLLLGTTISLSLVLGYLYITETRASFHSLPPCLLRLLYPDAEDSHHAGVYIQKVLYRFGLHPRERGNDGGGDLAISVFDQILNNPVAISGGA